MTTIVEAIYDHGVLRLQNELPLPDHTRVRLTIESFAEGGDDSERAAWLQLSEASLTKVWDNPGDDAFNELLKK
ncbi:MAG: antitoxin family protein [Verrucomicrobia bacterium]|nr:antitoxin family protein [Verrucomicrobiota bacterium]